jgi:glycosyltransferase involved in cell wall biosynthesis
LNKRPPLISIVTVVYNGSGTLEKTILSVIDQSFPDYEYVIIDGGSKDGTQDIIKRYQDRITYWISEPDKGVYDAMNKATKVCQGQYIFFLGADDLLLPGILAEIAPALISPLSIYYGNVFMTIRRTVYDGYFSPWKLAVRNICHQAIFYPSQIFQQYQYNLKYKLMADYELNIRLLGSKQYHFHYLDKLISHYQDNGLSASNVDSVFEESKPLLIKDNFSPTVYYYYSLRRYLSKKIKSRLP